MFLGDVKIFWEPNGSEQEKPSLTENRAIPAESCSATSIDGKTRRFKPSFDDKRSSRFRRAHPLSIRSVFILFICVAFIDEKR